MSSETDQILAWTHILEHCLNRNDIDGARSSIIEIKDCCNAISLTYNLAREAAK
jgi:hypothetical protein